MYINPMRYFFLILAVLSVSLFADKGAAKKDTLDGDISGAFKWRSIGPSFASGRIADFAVNPKNISEYFVAVASGHIWKTTNRGVTFDPVFDNYGSYSIGCLALDAQNPFTIWAGTGENNHQRSLGYGDGVYKSTDGGKSWTNMGLKESRQIGKIIVDPRNSNIVFVAAEGSVWGPGGDRGLYKSYDGGKKWNKVLNISEHTGVNNIAYDYRNPDIMYATSEQRRRHVYGKIGGGPESAVYKSTDAGETWEKIMSGLPPVDIGGMGLAVSPANPDYIYLIVEAALGKGGFFRSTNRGASWEKMSDHTEAGQYYNEIVCDPLDVNKVYSTETISQVTLDGGKTWKQVGNNKRHVDDHAIWIDPADTRHFLIGSDGGAYESFDGGVNFDFKENLPVIQFYRVNVDNDFPFFNIYGGTQDNNSMGGPSRTIYSNGIVNSDWFITNGGDGFWTAIDPVDPNIVYAEAQYGNMVRYDKKSGESVGIRPEPGKGELTYRWQWNTPLLISPHKNTRLYTSANVVFRSDDRGDSWQAISGDLTAQIDRNSLKVMDKYWSYDAVAKDRSTSQFGIIISLCESPVKENLLYAGTDDGLIQITEDAKNWRKSGSFPGVPENTYVSDICASKFDENIVFACFDNILRDDFTPYILKSNDKGKTWKSISSNLPAKGTVHTIEQDFQNPALLFAGTESGLYVTTNGGETWSAFSNGLPTIAVRDMAIQKRESALVLATFGRGFYILDDYSPLRTINKELLDKESHAFASKKTLMFYDSYRDAPGATFAAPNPEIGAEICFYVKDVPKMLADERREKEKELFKKGEKIPQPDKAQILAEEREVTPYFLVTIADEAGNVVRKISKAAAKGVQKVVWDLRYQSISPVQQVDKFNPAAKQNNYLLAMPGKYTANVVLVSREGIKEIAGPVNIEAEVLRNTTLPAEDRGALVAFQKKAGELVRTFHGTTNFLSQLIKRVETLKQAVINTAQAPHGMLLTADSIAKKLDDLYLVFYRRSNKPSAEENPPAQVILNERMEMLVYNHWGSTTNITKTEETAYNVLLEELSPAIAKLKSIYNDDVLPFEQALEKYNAPYTPGRVPELK